MGEEELHATITTRAELDRAFARQLVELASAVMARNLTYLLDQAQQHSDEQEARFTAVVKAELATLHADIRSQETAIHDLEVKIDNVKDDLHKRVDEIDAAMHQHANEIDERQSRERAALAAKVDELRERDAARLHPDEVQRLVAQIGQHDTELAQIKVQLGLSGAA